MEISDKERSPCDFKAEFEVHAVRYNWSFEVGTQHASGYVRLLNDYSPTTTNEQLEDISDT